MSPEPSTLEANSPRLATAKDDDIPDGGEGWVVVFGCAIALFSTTGVINAYVRRVSLPP